MLVATNNVIIATQIYGSMDAIIGRVHRAIPACRGLALLSTTTEGGGGPGGGGRTREILGGLTLCDRKPSRDTLN